MFLKPISIRSNTQLKNSERKHLISDFRSLFNLEDSQSGDIFSSKNVHIVKVTTCTGSKIDVYKFNEVPLIFRHNDKLFPTIFLTWHLPSLLPTFKVHDDLVPKLCGGADLMLPGVVLDEPLSPYSFNKINKDVLCSVTTISSRAPIAIGFTTMSSYDMFMSAGKGKAVVLTHCLGDQICSLGTCPPRPMLEWATASDSLPSEMLGATKHDHGDVEESTTNDLAEDINKCLKDLNMDNPSIEVDHDEILRNCFLRSLKMMKENELPMPVNIFYSQHVLIHRPPSVDLDIKKTAFKKVIVFLKAMQDEGFIELDQPKPGVFMLKRIFNDHLQLRDVNISPELLQGLRDHTAPKWPDGYYGPPSIQDVRIVKGPVSALYCKCGLKVGSCITQSEARQLVDNYVRVNNLQRADNPSMVQLDETLFKFCDPKSYDEAPESTLSKPIFIMSFQQLFSAALKNLPAAFKIQYPNQTEPVIWSKPEIPSIILYSTTKAGKKLTRIANLDFFHIDPQAFAKQLQSLLACSVGQVDDAQYPGMIVIQAQGNHLSAISTLLADAYAIPKRYIKGYTEPNKKKAKQR